MARTLVVALLFAFTFVAMGSAHAEGSGPSATQRSTGATADFSPQDPPGEWRRQARDYANTRYSTLDQITPENVGRLHVAWTFSDGVMYGHEGAPLVIGDTMYVVTPFPDVAYALDLSKPGSPIKWKFEPKPSPAAAGKACCDPVIRGWAYGDGKLVYNMLDAHTVALDAETGKEVWRAKLGEVNEGVTTTMAPFIVRDKVYVGNSGGELGVHGWLAALDLKTGKELWRAFSTGTDEMVRIGSDFKPFYQWMQGKDLGAKTWPKDAWRHGGGAVWGWISYDPSNNEIYYGTSNPGPRVPEQRPGLNLWTSAVIARDADTGMAKWAYQFTPHDEWDYDGTNENILIDVPFGGATRKALVHLNRNGFAYTIDRETGEVLLAEPYGDVNWASKIDLKTGKPVVNPDKEPKPEVKIENICPTHIGFKDWQPAAFSPKTGLIYAGTFTICMDLTDHKVSYIPGTPYDGMEITVHPQNDGKWGRLIAWDPVHGRIAWSIDEKFMTMSGVVATASNLIFYGTVDGWFRAVDARSGDVLWSQKLGSGIVAQPMTYLGPDGRQYVAVYAGVGGEARQSKKENGYPPRGSTLYVFSVDGLSVASGPGLKTTEAKVPAALPDTE